MPITPEKELEKLNKKVNDLFDLYDIDFADPTEATYEMRYALAQFYAVDGVRKFMENIIKKAEKDRRKCVTVLDIVRNDERLNVLLQILTTAKSMFKQAQTLEKGLEDEKDYSVEI